MTRFVSAFAISILLLTLQNAHADAPVVDYNNISRYFQALYQSKDPAAIKIVHEIENGPRDLDREVAACRAEGIPVDLPSIKPPTPPDNRNAATILDKLDNEPFIPFPNYADSLRSKYSYTSEQLATVSKILAKNANLINQMHAAARMPECQFATDWVITLTAPKFSGAKWRAEARALTTESILLAENGRYREGANSQVDVFKLSRHFLSRPGFGQRFTGYATTTIALDGIASVLELSLPNATLADSVASDIKRNMPNLSLREAMNEEIALQISLNEFYRTQPPAQVVSLLASSPIDNTTFSEQDKVLIEDLLDAQSARYIDLLRQLRAVADEPPAQRRSEFERLTDLKGQDPDHWLEDSSATHSTDPTVYWIDATKVFVGYEETHVDEDLARESITLAACAALKAKTQTGSYPKALPSTYIDPFNGKPLGYRREGRNGFVIYSVGPSIKFNGGPSDKGIKFPELGFRYPVKKEPMPKWMRP